MKKIILLPLLLVLLSCYEGERSCKDFKTGKFKFEHEVDGVKKTTFFERNDSIEIETYEGKTDSASIRWVSDCEYILQKIRFRSMEYLGKLLKFKGDNNEEIIFNADCISFIGKLQRFRIKESI